MALEPITRQEQIIAGKDLEPITRMERFLKDYGVSNYFGETTVMGDTLTWDGNTEGLEYVKAFKGYKVSDAVLTEENLLNASLLIIDENGEHEPTGEMTISKPFEGAIMCGGLNGIENEMLIIVINDVVAEKLGASAGTYFSLGNAGDTYVSSLTIPGYNGFETTTIQPIDAKYLPEHLQFGTEKAFEPISFVLDGNYAGVETTQLSNGRTYIKLYDKYVPEAAVESLSLSMNGQTETINGGSIAAGSHGWTASGFAASDGHESQTLPEGVWVMDFFVNYKIPVTVSVIPKVSVTPLAEQYMPILTSPSGKKFKLSVDDSGVLSATEV